MKWGVALIVLLGLVAALFAAIMVRSLLMGEAAGDKAPEQTEAVLAVADMPAMTVITSAHIEKRTVPKEKLPAGFLNDPAQATGRILGMPVVEGQVLKDSDFIENGTGAQVAASLPEGMRAIPVIISSNQIKGGLLYPGSVVDVLAAFKLSGNNRGQALSTTLLSNIQVLAVHGTSVAAKNAQEEGKGGASSAARSGGGSLTVTLMVTPRQAEALQLATVHGTLALTLRNPLDKKPIDTEATVLSEGRLAELGSAMASAVGTGDEPEAAVVDPLERMFGPGPGTKAQETEAPPAKTSWPVTVIRGQAVKQEDVRLPEEG